MALKYTMVEKNKLEARINTRGDKWLVEAWMGDKRPHCSIFRERKGLPFTVWEGVRQEMLAKVPAKVLAASTELMMHAETM